MMQDSLADSTTWHTHSTQECILQLQSDTAKGLDSKEAASRLQHYGPNAIPESRQRTLLQLLLSQFANLMIAILLLAALIAGIMGEVLDAVAILVIVLLNAVVGTLQEYRAEKAIAALRMMATPDAKVRRDAQPQVIPSDTLVPGDLIYVEAGNIVPADLRIIESAELKVQESALTGESVAVIKNTQKLDDPHAPLGDRSNMLYKGTQISYGHGLGVAVATGLHSELGKIASLLEQAEHSKTPLQLRLERFGQRLALLIVAIAAILFAAGILRGEPVLLMLLTAVSLAVAAIPEALPAVVTMSLALGAHKMSRQHALMRRLPAVETLGSVTYICSDKTGTLTQNSMHFERAWFNAQEQKTLGDGKDPVSLLLQQALLLNSDVERTASGETVGDPTETALYDAAYSVISPSDLLSAQMTRVGEIPFDATRKMMSTLHRDGKQIRLFTKGAPEMLLQRCSRQLIEGELSPCDSDTVLAASETLAAQGYRVLAFATNSLEALPSVLESDAVEQDLIFLGLIALIDPPRAEAFDAVAECKGAGMIPVMITGDHPVTAKAIALRVGIAHDASEVLTGAEIKQMSQMQLYIRVRDIAVYARVSPEQKIEIVAALQAAGEFVAMTGDGVNDAPSLKSADIGIAMGKKGTDVAREAADMVLLDDNFATIVRAVKEGRRIYDNVRKFVRYTMTSNAGEIWTLFLAPLVGLPIPLLPIQILWINLVTDGLPGLALALEPSEKNIMKRPPRRPDESIFANGMWQQMLWVGLLIGGLSLISQAWAISMGSEHWQSVVFTTLTLAQLANVMALRSEYHSLFTTGLGGNPLLLAAVVLTFILQMALLYIPWFHPIFQTTALSLNELAVCIGLAMTVFFAVEAEKWLIRRGKLYSITMH